MVDRLREKPGSHGLITANGWYMTKQSVGVYSTEARPGDWQRGDDSVLQTQLDHTEYPVLDPKASGGGTVETYTVVCGQAGPEQGVVIGRLDNGRRFVAHTPNDPATLENMMNSDVIGRRGQVRPGEPTNHFHFD